MTRAERRGPRLLLGFRIHPKLRSDFPGFVAQLVENRLSAVAQYFFDEGLDFLSGKGAANVAALARCAQMRPGLRGRPETGDKRHVISVIWRMTALRAECDAWRSMRVERPSLMRPLLSPIPGFSAFMLTDPAQMRRVIKMTILHSRDFHPRRSVPSAVRKSGKSSLRPLW
jgi:hypothetical protein